MTSHTQISDLFEGLILRSHPIGSKSKCNRVSQPPRRLWHSITLGLWPRCLRTSKFLWSVDLPRNCMHHECFLIPSSFQKWLYIYCLLVHAPTPWTQTRKPWTVTTLATGRWTNDQDNSYHGTQKKKKEKEEFKKKRPLPLFDWQVYPKWNVQFLNVAPWPNDEPCFCPGPPTSAWFETSTVFITVDTASNMAVSHTSSSSSRGRRVAKKEPVLRCRLGQLRCSVALFLISSLILSAEKLFPSLDRSARDRLWSQLSLSLLGSLSDLLSLDSPSLAMLSLFLCISWSLCSRLSFTGPFIIITDCQHSIFLLHHYSNVLRILSLSLSLCRSLSTRSRVHVLLVCSRLWMKLCSLVDSYNSNCRRKTPACWRWSKAVDRSVMLFAVRNRYMYTTAAETLWSAYGEHMGSPMLWHMGRDRMCVDWDRVTVTWFSFLFFFFL